MTANFHGHALNLASALLGIAALALATAAPAGADDRPFSKAALRDGDQILFLGDSITQSGQYVAFIQLYLWDRYPGFNFEIVNVGLGGETASGNNEPTHPYPRPVIHQRLPRILEATDPDLVLICYGMNDGIYHPFDSGRFADYRDGMTGIFDIYHEKNVPMVLMTPTLFDLPSARQRAPMAAASSIDYPFAYNNYFIGYDQVLQRYAEWVLAQSEYGVASVDLHSALYRFVRFHREADKTYLFGDGVHPSAEGHLAMAVEILQALEGPTTGEKTISRLAELTGIDLFAIDGSKKPTPLWQKMLQRERLLSAAWRESIGHSKPNKTKALPLDEAKAKAAELESEIRAMLAEVK